MMRCKFDFWQTDGEWYWHMRGANGEIVAQGEGYKKAPEMVATVRKYFVSGHEVKEAALIAGLFKAGLNIDGYSTK